MTAWGCTPMTSRSWDPTRWWPSSPSAPPGVSSSSRADERPGSARPRARPRRPARDGRDLRAALRPRRAPAAWHRTRAHQPDLPVPSPRAVTAAPLAPERARDPRGRPRPCRRPFKGGGSHSGHPAGSGRPGGGSAARPSGTRRRRMAWVRSPRPQSGASRHRAQQNLGDMPVPNSTELHHTQANIHQAAAQKILGLSSPECVGVRPGTTS